MAKSNDWLPSRRDEILGMAMKWNNVLVIKGTAWSVPEPKSTGLNTLTLAAQAAYNEAMTKDRTTVLTAKVNMAFKNLINAMRDIKKRYFFMLPLKTVPGTIWSPVHNYLDLCQARTVKQRFIRQLSVDGKQNLTGFVFRRRRTIQHFTAEPGI